MVEKLEKTSNRHLNAGLTPLKESQEEKGLT